MKVWEIAGISVLALGLVLGLALPALAAPEGTPLQARLIPPKVLRGEVISIDEGTSFVIQSGAWETTISVDSDTQYFKAFVPQKVVTLARHRWELRQQYQEQSGLMQQSQGQFGPKKGLGPFLKKAKLFFNTPLSQKITALARHRLGLRQQAQEKLELRLENQEGFGLGRWLHPFVEEAIFDDITVGSRVVVRAVPGEDNPLAKMVFIVEPTEYGRVLGTVTGISPEGKTITIAPADGGDDVILSYSDGTRFILRGAIKLEEGDSVRAVYDEEKVAKVVSMVVAGLD